MMMDSNSNIIAFIRHKLYEVIKQYQFTTRNFTPNTPHANPLFPKLLNPTPIYRPFSTHTHTSPPTAEGPDIHHLYSQFLQYSEQLFYRPKHGNSKYNDSHLTYTEKNRLTKISRTMLRKVLSHPSFLHHNPFLRYEPNFPLPRSLHAAMEILGTRRKDLNIYPSPHMSRTLLASVIGEGAVHSW